MIANRNKKSIQVWIRFFIVLAIFVPHAANAAWFNAHDVSQGLVAKWTLDEGGGVTAKDTSGNGNTGTLVSSPTWVSGKIGKALNFVSASSQYVNVGNASNLNVTGDLTISLWFKTPSVSTTQTMVSKRDHPTGNSEAYEVSVYQSKLEFGQTPTTAYQGNTTLLSNTWYHGVITRTASQITLYINGSNDGTRTVTDAPTSVATTNTLIGALDNAGLVQYFNGTIDDVRIYNRALSAAEVATIYNAAKPSTVASSKPALNAGGLVGWWTFDGKDMNWATNLAIQSQAFNLSPWASFHVTIVADQTAAPDGTVTADLIYATDTSTFRDILQNTTNPSAVYTQSVYVKQAGFTWVEMRQFTGVLGAAWFNLSTGTIGTVSAGYTATITALPNGWYRISTTQATPVANPNMSVGAVDGDNTMTATGSGTNGIYVWGAQLETGSVATPYIPTTTVAATGSVIDRHVTSNAIGNNGAPVSMSTAANVSGVTGQALKFDGTSSKVQLSQIPISGNGTYTASMWFKPTASGGTNLSWGARASKQEFYLQYNSNTNLRVGHFGDDHDTTVSNLVGAWHHVVVTYNQSTEVLYLDGVQINSWGENTLNFGSTGAYMGVLSDGAAHGGGLYNGIIDDVRIYNRALSATEVKNLYNTSKPATAASSQTSPSANGGLVGWWTFDGKDMNWATNIIPHSQDTTGWVPYHTTYTANATVAPDGSTTATQQLETAINQNQISYGPATQNGPITGGTTWTWSVYLKGGLGRQWAIVDAWDSPDKYSYFDLTNGVTGTNAAGSTSTITPVGNGWYRCTVTRTTAAGTANQGFIAIGSASADNTPSFLGDITKGVYWWGAQLEEGSVATPYVPTTATIFSKRAFDKSGQGNTGTPSGLTALTSTVPGKLGQALKFNGTSNFVSLPSTGTQSARGNMGFASSDNFTLSVWYKGTDTDQNGEVGKGLLSWNSSAIWAAFALRSGYAEFIHYDGTWEHNIKSTTLVADGRWHLITYVNSSNNTGSMYVDGIAQVTGQSSSISTGSGLYFQPSAIGLSYNNIYTTGTIDDVRIYNRALSATEVKSLYNTSR